MAIAALGLTKPTRADPTPPRAVYHVGVWYFTRWNSETHPFPGRSADPWTGIHEFAAGRGPFRITDPRTGQEEDYSDREPRLGFYNLMSQSVVDDEIREAASEGIDFFAFYWYLDLDTGQERPISAPTRLFFESPVSHLMRYLLAPLILLPKNWQEG